MSDDDRNLQRALQQLRFRHLKALIALQEAGSIASAAEVMAMSQPALTKMLREIEAMVGQKLFHRSNRGTIATPIGVVLCRNAYRLQAALHETVQDIRAVEDGRQGRVVVGAILTAATALIPAAIGRFKEVLPGATVNVLEGFNDRHLPGLLSGDIDMVVGRVPQSAFHDRLTQEPLFEETLRFFVRADHAVKAASVPDLSALVDYPWVLPPRETALRRQIEEMFFRIGLSMPTDLVETLSLLTVRHLVLNTDRIGALPGHVLELEHDAGLVRALPLTNPSTDSRVGVILRQDGHLSPAAQVFLDALRQEAGVLRKNSVRTTN